jgi:hypothetical protein
MSRRRRFSPRIVEQRGAVLVTAALFMPVALLFFAFVVDAGYSWLHQRHLQVQADAAAFAAAQGFQPCSDTTISSEAQQYGGVAGSTIYNQQIGGTPSSNIHQLINSQTFYNQPTPVDSSTDTRDPCSAGMVDVKMTETDLPWWLAGIDGILSTTPFINAQARVEIRQKTIEGPGSLPVAVNDFTFKNAEAYFINESTGNQIGTGVALKQTGTVNGLATWSSAANPYSLTVPTGTTATSDVGVRIALSGSAALTGTMSSDCALTSVLCYDNTSSTSQLLDVHGWSSSGTGSMTPTWNPVLRQVVMTAGSCGDQYYTNSATNCSQGVQVSVDLGAAPTLNGLTVSANGTALNCPTSAQPLVCTGSVNISAGSGRNRIDITVKKGNNSTTFTNAQSTYAWLNGGSGGPIQAATLVEGAAFDVSSLQQGTTHSLVIQIGVTPGLSVAQSINDAPIVLRFDGTGSQNQSVSCNAVNGASTFSDMLASGCVGPYQINQTLTCPDNNTPADCLPPATGNKQNQVAKGINQRVLGSTTPSSCTAPNNWSSFPNLAPSDPRIITLFVTPYGSFSGSGASTLYPIETFAAFYITGWADNGNGFNNPCQGNGDDTAQPGTIVGHFIKYVDTLNTGSTGGTSCVLNSVGECVAVLTR